MVAARRARRGASSPAWRAQFAFVAVDRLCSARDTDAEGAQIVLLAAADPAQRTERRCQAPTPMRSASPARCPAPVVLLGGEAALYVERGGRGLVTLPAMADPEVASLAVAALTRLIGPAGPMREVRLERVDRVPPAESLLAEALRGIGFRPSYRAWLLRP
jgi:ATP-dependent Lhr-like helicase